MMPKRSFYNLRNKRVWVAGHNGLVGSALVRRLENENCEVLIAPRDQVDLRSAEQLERWIRAARPEAIFLAAARVGGIHANSSRPADFTYDNLMIQSNVIEAARRHDVEKLMFLGSTCIYPRLAPQPIPEEALLSGPLEPTNQWYAIAKIAGITLCDAYRQQYGADYIAVMPTNLYGPGDNFDLADSHAMPALIAKAHRAKCARAAVMEVWGTGRAVREFLYVDDAADGMVFLMKHYSDRPIINIGTGLGITIRDLTTLVCRLVGFTGQVRYDETKPDGTPHKVSDVQRIHHLGWRAQISLEEGIERTYRWYVDHQASTRRTRLEPV
jgi:GDP-L-fucose synthase